MPQLTPQAFVMALQVENNPHLGSANLAQGERLWGLTLHSTPCYLLTLSPWKTCLISQSLPFFIYRGGSYSCPPHCIVEKVQMHRKSQACNKCSVNTLPHVLLWLTERGQRWPCFSSRWVFKRNGKCLSSAFLCPWAWPWENSVLGSPSSHRKEMDGTNVKYYD